MPGLTLAAPEEVSESRFTQSRGRDRHEWSRQRVSDFCPFLRDKSPAQREGRECDQGHGSFPGTPLNLLDSHPNAANTRMLRSPLVTRERRSSRKS